MERGGQPRDDGREHRCGPRRRRVGRHASPPASRRAIGPAGRRPVPSGARQTRPAVRGGGSRRRRRDGRSAAEARLPREGTVRGAGRRRGVPQDPQGPEPALVAHRDADCGEAAAAGAFDEGAPTGCGRTSCCACSPTTSSGTCDKLSSRSCSTTTTRPRLNDSAPPSFARPSARSRHAPRPPASAPTTTCPCTASEPCSPTSAP